MDTQLIGTKTSFIKLIDSGYILEIPIIQRDYAQGRESAKDVRDSFLHTLYSYIKSNNEANNLDFIYGATVDGTFVILDGQQRLTTLFLLHWYLANISNNQKQFLEKMMTPEGNPKFSYKIRISSQEFCKQLIKYELPRNDKKISDLIKNEPWFFNTWEQDPTILSMLEMLDAIQDRFKDEKDFYDRLCKENSPITFYLLDLEKYSLTDELYILMNSRGKSLTPFENFKAKIEQYLEKIDKGYELPRKGSKVPIKDYFSNKIDIEWTNLFWQYAKEDKKPQVDLRFENFIQVILAAGMMRSEVADEYRENMLRSKIAKDKRSFSYNFLEGNNAISQKNLEFLISVFDVLENGDNTLKEYLSEPFKYYYNENEIFKKIIDNKYGNYDFVMFHAYVTYLIKHKADLSNINHWMRVVCNLVTNSEIDSGEKVNNAIVQIEKLSEHSDIITHLTLLSEKDISFFYNEQIKEEILKAKLIKKSDQWEKAILDAEKIEYFQGQIGFILYLGGMSDTDGLSTESPEKFITYAHKVKAVFNERKENNNKYQWERAVLSKWDYTKLGNRFNFLNSDENKRDYSWKRRLRKPEEGECIRAVLDDPKFSLSDTYGSLETICNNYFDKDWRSLVIRNGKIIGYCSQGFFGKENDQEIMLISKTKMSSYHVELYTYDLFTREFKGKTIEPLGKFEYYQSYGEALPCIYAQWIFNDITYELCIYYESKDESNELYCYNIWFYREDEVEITDKILINILETLKYKLIEEDDVPEYIKYCDNEEDVHNQIKKICDKLKTLDQ